MRPPECEHKYPELCRLLDRHIYGGLLDRWNDSVKYRAAWCQRAGLDLEEMERRFPPEQKQKLPEAMQRGYVVTDERNKKPPGRVGAELKKLIQEKYHISPKQGCGCNDRAAEMDQKGLEWCEQNKETIVGWLCEGAFERYWIRPVVVLMGGTLERIALGLLDEAIERAKKCSS